MKWKHIISAFVFAMPSVTWAADMPELEARAAKGDVQAYFELAQTYRLGQGVRANLGKARGYYRKAAARGHLDAGAALALIVYYVDGEKDEGVRLWRNVAVCGHGASAMMLAAIYANGEQTPGNIALARGFASIARKQGEAGADALLQKLGGMTPGLDDQALELRASCAFEEHKMKALQTVSSQAQSGVWRVQVGAFSSRVAAARAWALLMNAFPVQTEGMAPHFEESPVSVGDTRLIRLQLLGYDNADEANRVCRIFLEKKHACMVIAP